MAQIRSGTLPLRVETGRFINTPLEARICGFCNRGAIEDEMHFIHKCELYAEERRRFFTEDELNGEINEQSAMLQQIFKDSPRQFARYLSSLYLRRKGIEYPEP